MDTRRVGNFHPSYPTKGRSIGTVPAAAMLMICAALVIAGMLYCATEPIVEPQRPAITMQNKIATLERSIDSSKEFVGWVPVSFSSAADPLVTLCELNLDTVNLVQRSAVSNCMGKSKQEKLSDLTKKAYKYKKGDYRILRGVVVTDTEHVADQVSRLLSAEANMIVVDGSLLFDQMFDHSRDEPLPSDNKISAIQSMIDFLSSTTASKTVDRSLFLIFKPSTLEALGPILEAIPDVPWVYIYSNPEHSVMHSVQNSNYADLESSCFASEKDLSLHRASLSTQALRRCVSRVGTLGKLALEALTKPQQGDGGGTRGLVLPSESLPGSGPRLILPHLGITAPSQHWLSAMEKVVSSSEYINLKAVSATQTSVAQVANMAASSEFNTLKLVNRQLLDATKAIFTRLRPPELYPDSYSVQSEMFSNQHINVDQCFASVDQLIDGAVNLCWSELSKMPKQAYVRGRVGHSALPEVPIIPFEAWNPHSNVHLSRPFEAVNCPDFPAPNYPKAYSMLNEVLANWNTDNTEIPAFHYDSLCHFDYQDPVDNQKAWNYREKEMPFVIYNMPSVDEIVTKWSDTDYMKQKLGGRFKMFHTETSATNHFMYHSGGHAGMRLRGTGNLWSPPTQSIKTSYDDWLELAERGQNASVEKREHQYFRVSSNMGSPWLFDEMKFYKPEKSLLLVQPREQQGIHCRFGMRGIIAEAHFDGGRNVAAIMSGLRRWVLTHPNQCENMHMLQKGHPSARHSDVDWSKPNVTKFPNFPKVMGNEVILQPGDILYVPIYWIHYIVSLNVNIQCNTRSGRSSNYDMDIRHCGF